MAWNFNQIINSNRAGAKAFGANARRNAGRVSTLPPNYANARREAQAWQSQWNGRGGNLNREQIYGNLIGMGYRPETASYTVYGSGLFPDRTNIAGVKNPDQVKDPNNPYGNKSGMSGANIQALADAHNRTLAQIKRAYDAGLITYEQSQAAIEQNRKSLGEQKKTGLESNNAYFSKISPNAYQSQQGVYNTNLENKYNEGVGQINQQQDWMNRSKALDEQAYQDSIAQENQSYALQKAGGTGIGGGGGYSGFSAAGAPGYDQNQLASNIQKYIIQAQGAGLNEGRIQNRLRGQIAGLNIPQADKDQLLQIPINQWLQGG